MILKIKNLFQISGLMNSCIMGGGGGFDFKIQPAGFQSLGSHTLVLLYYNHAYLLSNPEKSISTNGFAI